MPQLTPARMAFVKRSSMWLSQLTGGSLRCRCGVLGFFQNDLASVLLKSLYGLIYD